MKIWWNKMLSSISSKQVILGLTLKVLLFAELQGVSQQKNLPLNLGFDTEFKAGMARVQNQDHQAVRPYLESMINIGSMELKKKSRSRKSLIGRKLFEEHLIRIEKDQFRLFIDPLFDFSAGSDLTDTLPLLLVNTRGLLVQADITEKVSIQTGVYENQASFPRYVAAFADDRGVIPGQGRHKKFKEGKRYDYSLAFGHISYSPIKQLNVQFGHGNHFIGNGYRSLLLSDNAANALYLKATTTLLKGRLLYSSIFSNIQTLDRIPAHTTPEALFKPKFASFHFLNLLVGNLTQLGLFEGTIFRRYDNTEGTVPAHFSAYIPLILANSAINGVGNKGDQNVVLGLNALHKFSDNLQVYGQLMFDDLSNFKGGLQLGVRTFDLLNLEGLSTIFEYNSVSKYAYSHSDPLVSYTHYNQELAHPLGASFREAVGIIQYRRSRLFGNCKLMLARRKENGVQRIGSNPLLSDQLPTTGLSELEASIASIQLELGYSLNVKTGMQIVVGYTNRTSQRPGLKEKANFVFIGLRTTLRNKYYDF